MEKTKKAFEELVKVVYELRIKCPWDREQTFDSIRNLTIEEVYELSEAILKKDFGEIKEELGDIFLHLILYSRIAEEQGKFDLADVLIGIKEKLIRRHPHVYGEVKLSGSKAVIKNWEKLKQKEKKSVLQGVPESMPSLLKAYRMQQKAAGVGFDWDNIKNVKAKVLEELQEMENASSPQEQETEFGDLLFALVNYARHKGINPEDALEKANLKFKERFLKMEKLAAQDSRKFSELSLEEQESLWRKVKTQENNS